MIIVAFVRLFLAAAFLWQGLKHSLAGGQWPDTGNACVDLASRHRCGRSGPPIGCISWWAAATACGCCLCTAACRQRSNRVCLSDHRQASGRQCLCSTVTLRGMHPLRHWLCPAQPCRGRACPRPCIGPQTLTRSILDSAPVQLQAGTGPRP
jgi:hypothetical protein